MTDKFPNFEVKHLVMLTNIECGKIFRYIQSGGLTGVWKVGPNLLKTIWEGFKYHYVQDDQGVELDDIEKGKAIKFAEGLRGHEYQHYKKDKPPEKGILHYNVNEYINWRGSYFDDYGWGIIPNLLRRLAAFNIYINCVRKFLCDELIWASYLEKTFIDIAEPHKWDDVGLGEAYYGIGPGTIIKDNNIEPYDAINEPLLMNYDEDTADGTVDASRENDDPVNNTWRTIQQGIDNLTTHQTLYIKNGNYEEDIVIDNSLSIIGETKNNVKINGSITMVDELDYELPNYGKDSIIVEINMSGNELLFHFNNDSSVGENFSSLDNIFDYSGLNNNGTKYGTIWNTTTIKGNGSFDFDGIDDSINTSSLSALSGENITVSSWVYWESGSGLKNPIISQSNVTQGYCLYINNTTNKPVFRLDADEVISSTILNGGWHNIVGTHNETNLKIYVDGILRGNITKTGSGSDLECYIGFDNNSDYFKGTIDEIAVWNKTFSDNEISIMYKANYGVSISNFTLQNSYNGLILGNHSGVYDFLLSNVTKGIYVENISEAWIAGFNIAESGLAIDINNSNPGIYERIFIGYGNITNCSNGVIINSSSFGLIEYVNFNCTNNNLQFNDCNINKMSVSNCTVPGNFAPAKPCNISGPTLGYTSSSYSYNTKTNDSDNDPIYYRIYWGDGNMSEWLGPYNSNETIYTNHTWSEEGGYGIFFKSMDVLFQESEWSEVLLFRTEENPPLISNVSNYPDAVGFGGNITISANIVDDSQNSSDIQDVYVNITYPDTSDINVTMTDIGNDTYQYVFNDTWAVGQYNYTIWALDNAYITNSSSGHSFNISSQAIISVRTIKDEYGDNEFVNLTDPPGPSYKVGYELLDDDKVLHIWNPFDSYYFNTSNGIQFTNHKDEYWSTNVLMLGYYNNDVWNLIYRTDELSSFNKNIISDNETFVNATLWKNLNYEGYDFRLAIRYYLGVDDNELTIIPYIKNIDDEDIPYNLGFVWELKDIQIDMTPSGDYIEIDDDLYYLNDTIDKTYTDLDNPCYYIRENKTSNTFESLYLHWDNDLNYKLKVESRDGQYNAPVTLGIKIGTLSIGQEKYTSLFWHDASEKTFYFDDYYNSEVWAFNPSNMVDGSISNYASTGLPGDVELLDNNTCTGINIGTISKVEIRAYGYHTFSQRDIYLRPIFDGNTDGNNHTFPVSTTAAWSRWNDITNDEIRPSHPAVWTWGEIRDLDCDIEAEDYFGLWYLYCSKVEIRVTFTPPPPEINNPYPVNCSDGISINPVLNISVSNSDGSLMNITWLSNSSGSWQTFGTNNSVSNGTYHQVFTNASVNGQWWYWQVNISDEDGYNISGVFKFYTGVQSKIVNYGSTYIRGYLLIQVHYYNTSTENWIVANDTINETTYRTLESDTGGSNNSFILGLDTIFNGLVNTNNLLDTFGSGTYRVYAAFRDPDGDVLVCDDESLLEASYEFLITTS